MSAVLLLFILLVFADKSFAQVVYYEPTYLTPQEIESFNKGEELNFFEAGDQDAPESAPQPTDGTLIPYEPEPMSPEEAEKLGIVIPELAIEPFVPETEPVSLNASEAAAIEPDKEQVMEYAKNFWDEDDSEKKKKTELNISGSKTFEIKQSDVKGDISHFSTEQFDSYPGFKMDQSLHLEIDGHINENSTVNAVLDDKEDEDRRFTVNINTPKWKFVLGDFQVNLENTELTLFSKEVRGIIAQGNMTKNLRSTFMFSQSKGAARREQFRGAGAQQEYRMQAFPIVQGSEQIRINGRLLQRSSDYLIDYEEGIIKFSASVLPIEITDWIVVEYETSNENLAFSRNVFGVRQEYIKSPERRLGVTWLRELDSKTPKAGADTELEPGETVASESTALITPMQHDVYGTDFQWQLGKALTVKGETAVSVIDRNINSQETPDDREIKGKASRFGVGAKTDKIEADATYYNIDSKFKLIGREDGVIELGERGLVNDVVSGRGKVDYKLNDSVSVFADGENAQTNLDNNPEMGKIDFEAYNGGFIWLPNNVSRFEFKSGTQKDKEKAQDVFSNISKDVTKAVFDRKFGKTTTQTKIEKTSYEDGVNIASGSEILHLETGLSSKIADYLSLNLNFSKIELEDGMVLKGLRSDTRNYSLDMNYEPSRIFNMRGQFQWRREDDMYANSRAESEIIDSQMQYEPSTNIKTQLKYKIENTSKIVRDDSLDQSKYQIPNSLPTDVQEEMQVLTRFENPVQKATTNFTADYRITEKIQAYLDWRRRDIEDRYTNSMISTTDRKTYELRFTPIEKMILTTEYEEGYSKDRDSKMYLKDDLKLIQLRHEFKRNYILDLTYEERDEIDQYESINDIFTDSKIVSFQRVFSPKVNMEVGVKYDRITDKDPSKEFEKNMAVTLTPSSRNQRYKFFIKHRDIKSTIDGVYYEGGVSLSQFIGSDTIIDGEIKKVHSSKLPSGAGYDATVINAKMIITF